MPVPPVVALCSVVVEPVVPPRHAPLPGPAYVAASIAAAAPAENQPPAHPAPALAAAAAAAAANAVDTAMALEALIKLAIAQVYDILPDIERRYLEQYVRAFLPQHRAQTGSVVLRALVAKGDWPQEIAAVGARRAGVLNTGCVNVVGKGKGHAMDDAEVPSEAKPPQIDYESVDRR